MSHYIEPTIQKYYCISITFFFFVYLLWEIKEQTKKQTLHYCFVLFLENLSQKSKDLKILKIALHKPSSNQHFLKRFDYLKVNEQKIFQNHSNITSCFSAEENKKINEN